MTNESSTRLLISSNNSGVYRQTRRYFNYQPGKSQLIFDTFTMGNSVSGVTKRVGYFDNNNGIFLEKGLDNVYYMVRRSNVSGSVVETKQSKSSWTPIPGDHLVQHLNTLFHPNDTHVHVPIGGSRDDHFLQRIYTVHLFHIH